jgi:hypothetical protein
MKKASKKPRSKAGRKTAGRNRRLSGERDSARKPKDDFIGRLKGVLRIVGDIESPVEPPEAWEYD